MSSRRLAIIGEGWAALAALTDALNRSQGASPEFDVIFWVPGSGGRVLPTVPSVEGELAASAIERMAAVLNVEIGPRISGASFLREFRNKSFREPVWLKGGDTDEQRERRAVELWKAEAALVPVSEVRWERSLFEIEEEFRSQLKAHSRIQRREGVPIVGFETRDQSITTIVFGSGEKLEVNQVIYADRWSRLTGLSGLPKSFPWNRGREPMGVLQVLFTHQQPIRPELYESYFTVLNRDSGDTEDRHLVGHFFRGGCESIWSVVISSEEGEDNHFIAKKLRRMKHALDKMFSGTEWASGEFSSTIKNESVRYEESILCGSGTCPLKQAGSGVEFVTDGYGVGSGIEQVFGFTTGLASTSGRKEGLTPNTQAEIRV